MKSGHTRVRLCSRSVRRLTMRAENARPDISFIRFYPEPAREFLRWLFSS
jgi:hypothetical protein